MRLNVNLPTGTVPNPGTVLTDIIMSTDVKERFVLSATSVIGTVTYDVLNQQILYYTVNSTGNFVINLRGNSSTTLNSVLSVGECITVVFMFPNGAAAYYNTSVLIDGAATTTRWQGGSAPSSGNINSVDVYSYAIMKIADGTFNVFASQTRTA